MRLYNPRLVFLYQALMLVVLSVALGWVVNEVRPDGLPWLDLNPQTTQADTALEAAAGIDLDEAMRRHADGSSVFVDARHQADFEAGHIPGAVNIPLGLFEDEIEAKLAAYGKDADYVVYCSSVTCGMAEELALALGFMEYPHVSVFAGGMEAWTEAGAEIEAVVQTADEVETSGQGEPAPAPAGLEESVSDDAAMTNAAGGADAETEPQSREVAQ